MYDMLQQNPWAEMWADTAEMWTDPAANPALEMWTDPAANPVTDLWAGGDDPMTMLADPELNPFADAFQFAHEPLNLWTGWALGGFEGNPFLDPELTPFAGLDATGLDELPAMDGTMFVDIWADIVESWLAVLGVDSDEFTSITIE